MQMSKTKALKDERKALELAHIKFGVPVEYEVQGLVWAPRGASMKGKPFNEKTNYRVAQGYEGLTHKDKTSEKK
jgi:hypothetical protein